MVKDDKNHYRELGRKIVEDYVDDYGVAGTSDDNLLSMLAGIVAQARTEYAKRTSSEVAAEFLYQQADKAATAVGICPKFKFPR